jgi:uncharacterized membrane protein YedE/YeeE
MNTSLIPVWRSLASGMLIGSGVAVLLLIEGQVAGISGIVDRTLHGAIGKQAWRLAFLAGLVLPAAIVGTGPIGWQAPPAILALAGVLVGFGTRLGSGMTDPANVVAFLDVGGAWRPSQALTMTGAVAVAFPAFAVLRSRGRTLRGQLLPAPGQRRIDRSLLLGSALYGVGWGLSGICPGPGLIVLASGDARAFLFATGVSLGMVAAGTVRRADAATEIA